MKRRRILRAQLLVDGVVVAEEIRLPVTSIGKNFHERTYQLSRYAK